jgi:DNA-directed RNA polymerase delta subunit
MVNTNFTFDRKLSPQELQLHDLVENLLIVLSDKEKYIIKNRFALHTDKRLTLEEIGQHFGVTRERVRQIEKTALRKLERNAQNTNIKILTEFAKALLQKEGGIASDDQFKGLLLKILPNVTAQEIQDLHLALTLDGDIVFESNTLKTHPYWRLTEFDAKAIDHVGSTATKLLTRSKHVTPLDKLTEKINETLKSSYPEHTVSNLLHIIKECKFTDQGVGLYTWRHIHPRTLRDKIFFILNHEKKPLHFEKIAQLIRDSEFDQKRVNIQAVHNELIRNDNFILIGRGIYALKEWGYKTGTVAEVISEILSDGTPRSREEITKAVLDQRHVKTITIYLNLKNKSQFARVGRDKYTLKQFA